MPDQKISELNHADNIAGTDLFAIVNQGETKNATIEEVLTLFGPVGLWQESTGNNIYYEDGSVGIGITQPGGLLGLGNSSTFLDLDGGNNLVLSDAVAGSLTLADLAYDEFADGGEARGKKRQLGNTDTYDLGFMTDGVERLLITDIGRVGMGTASPTGQLEVDHTNMNFRVISAGTACRIEQMGTGSEATLELIKADNNNTRPIIHAQGNGGGNTALWVGSGGNVGIGNTNPVDKLEISQGHVQFDNGYGIRFRRATGTANFGSVRATSGNELYIQSPHADGPVRIFNDGGEAMSLHKDGIEFGSGNKIIKTKNAGSDLIVWGQAGLTFRSSTQGLGNIIFEHGEGIGSVKAVIEPSGNVGIGTESPGEILEVVGNVKISGDVLLEEGNTLNDASRVTWNVDNYITHNNVGAGTLELHADLGIQAHADLEVRNDTAAISLFNTITAINSVLKADGISAPQEWTLPNNTGIIALLDDINTAVGDYLPLVGGTMDNDAVISGLNLHISDANDFELFAGGTINLHNDDIFTISAGDTLELISGSSDIIVKSPAVFDLDYSSTYVDRSIVDKAYVDSSIASIDSFWTQGSGNDIYFDNGTGSGSVGIGTDSPSGQFHVYGDEGVLFDSTAIPPIQYPIPLEGAGVRLMWYPFKASFRAGGVYLDEWDDINTGTFSVALGGAVKASGQGAVAMGYNLESTAFGSVALGRLCVASADGSFAAGYDSSATGNNSIAMGNLNGADGVDAAAVGGNLSVAYADYAFATGIGSEAHAFNSFVLGRYNVHSGTLDSWVTTEPLFVIGNGMDSGNLSNAFTVLKNAHTHIGGDSPGNDMLRVEGPAYATGGWNSSAADYAEYFESANGKAIPVGTAVTLTTEGTIKPARKGDIPFGIISANPGFIGNAPREWPKKYVLDEFHRPVMESYEEFEMMPKIKKVKKERQQVTTKKVTETVTKKEVVKKGSKYCQITKTEKVTREVEEPVFEEVELYDQTGKQKIGTHQIPVMETYIVEETVKDKNGQPILIRTKKKIKGTRPKLNPDYDPDKAYQSREERPEWNCVGLVGLLPLLKGQAVAPTWVKVKTLSDKTELWLVK